MYIYNAMYISVHSVCAGMHTLHCIICCVLYNCVSPGHQPWVESQITNLMTHAVAAASSCSPHSPGLLLAHTEISLGEGRNPRVSFERPTKTEERADALGSDD